VVTLVGIPREFGQADPTPARPARDRLTFRHHSCPNLADAPNTLAMTPQPAGSDSQADLMLAQHLERVDISNLQLGAGLRNLDAPTDVRIGRFVSDHSESERLRLRHQPVVGTVQELGDRGWQVPRAAVRPASQRRQMRGVCGDGVVKPLPAPRRFCTEIFYQFDYVHRHSGIGWHTPASVHFGTADAIDDARQATLTSAYHANPARFGRRPHPPQRPDKAWINQPTPAVPE